MSVAFDQTWGYQIMTYKHKLFAWRSYPLLSMRRALLLSVLFQDTSLTAIHTENLLLTFCMLPVLSGAGLLWLTPCECQNQLKSLLMKHKLFECLSMCKLEGAEWILLPNYIYLIAVFLYHREVCSSCSPVKRGVFYWTECWTKTAFLGGFSFPYICVSYLFLYFILFLSVMSGT